MVLIDGLDANVQSLKTYTLSLFVEFYLLLAYKQLLQGHHQILNYNILILLYLNFEKQILLQL